MPNCNRLSCGRSIAASSSAPTTCGGLSSTARGGSRWAACACRHWQPASISRRSATPARPVTFADFEHALVRNIAAAMGLSAALVSQDWSRTNYLSAPAELLDAWKTLKNLTRIAVATRWQWEPREIVPSQVPQTMVASTSFARRRLRLSQAMVRSTTQRRGSRMKPLAASERLTISMVQLPRPSSAPFSLSPA